MLARNGIKLPHDHLFGLRPRIFPRRVIEAGASRTDELYENAVCFGHDAKSKIFRSE